MEAENEMLKKRLKEIADLAHKVLNDEDGNDYLFDTMIRIEEIAMES